MAKSAFTINVEYAALRFFVTLMNAIPHAAAMAIARGIGAFASTVLRVKRCRTLERIRTVFPDMPMGEVKRVAVRSLQNMLLTGVELIRVKRFTAAWMESEVENIRECKDVLQKLVDEGHGVVVMVPHSGNWFMPAWACAKFGLKIFALGSRQRNPKINAWLYGQFGDCEVLDRDASDTLMQIKKRLEGGEAFAIMPDLRVRKQDVEADFLGGKANVSHAGAMFALHAKCPIMVAIMARDGNRHICRHLATLRPDFNANRREEAARLTREAMRLMSDEVMKNPGDWFWYNKRWVLEPVTNRTASL